jgi:hypothetical protein
MQLKELTASDPYSEGPGFQSVFVVTKKLRQTSHGSF